MELNCIEKLELYVDKEFEEDEEVVVKRVLLEDDLEIGETAYFRNGYRNKIVKQDKDEYIFYRFDEIQTHIEEYDSGYSIDDFREGIVSQLDYKLEYANERVHLVSDLIENSSEIYNMLSTNRVILKEQKKKNSFLSESQALDKQFEHVASYILHPKFNHKDSETYYDEIVVNYERIRDKPSRTNSEIVELMSLKDEIDLINQGIMTKSREKRNKLRENHVDDFTVLEATEKIATEFNTEKMAPNNSRKEIDINKDYWIKMGFTDKEAKNRQEIITNYKNSLDVMVKQLGHGKSAELKEAMRKSTMNKLEEVRFFNEQGKEIIITPLNRFGKLNKMYNELRSDYSKAKEILTVPLSFNQITPTFTEYNYNFDTWYISEDSQEVEVSKNMLMFSNASTYKGLIENYYDLKDKYEGDFRDDMWAILLYFEDLIISASLTQEERFVIERIMRDYPRKEILDDYFNQFNKKLTMRTLSRWVNIAIPQKLLNTYLTSIDDWVYTFILKGKFKKCSKCSEVKVISNDRYFGKNSITSDGFQSVCKKCDGLRK